MLLNCHTYYSLCYGTLAPEVLLQEAARLGYKQLVIADINATSAHIDSLRMADAYAIRVVPGIDFRNGTHPCYVGIAQNNHGLEVLNNHLSIHLHKQQAFEPRAPELAGTFIVYPLASYTGFALHQNEYVGVSADMLRMLPFKNVASIQHKLVVLQTVTFIQKRDYNAHRLLRAIDKNTLLSKLDPTDQATIKNSFIPRQQLEQAFAAYPDIVKNTERLLELCHVHIEMGKMSNKNKKHYTHSVEADLKLLAQKCQEGIAYRYPTANEQVTQRLNKELDIIGQMQFASYFLINWDIINYARHKDYFYVGRGSGANSLVAYLLRITDVDPIDLDLYFERFINPFRNNPPDFDIDFSWTDRDDITNYIFNRFDYKHTALLGTYTTLQHDAVIRELGKVFGMPPHEIDKLQQLKEPAKADSMGSLVLQYSKLLAGLPTHLSIHASGIVISEAPIHAYTATFLPPKGYPTTQFSMLEAEDIGLAKFDILSQRGLSKIKDAVQIVYDNKGVHVDIHNIPVIKSDPLVKQLLRQGTCIGCFYIESPAMRMLLSKLQADDYLRLVAASSIIRPGVSKSGMMQAYIDRYRDASKRDAARKQLPDFYDLLAETYGVMVYQEDVIKVAHYFAGLNLAEADHLRRGMSWKFKQRSEFHLVKERFFENCRNKGYPEHTVSAIWLQIESFANYAFSKAHSASYAVESFQALYLKAYHPLEYMLATINNGGGFYRTELYVHEARMLGATIMPPCINQSDALSTLQGTTLYLGLHMIKGITLESIRIILSVRLQNGLYLNLEDFISRTGLPLEQLILLIRVGAFGFTGISKKALLWQAHLHGSAGHTVTPPVLFNTPRKQYKLPTLLHTWLDDAYDEIELLGFALCSPFRLIKNPPDVRLKAHDLPQHIGKKVQILGYLINSKRTATHSGKKMYFGTFIDSDGHWVDTVHFPKVVATHPFTGPGCYVISGLVYAEYDFIYINVQALQRLSVLNRDEVVTNALPSLV